MRISKFLPEMDKLVCKGTVTISVNGAPLELPITSEGVLELRDELAYHKPIAPKKAIVIKADSEIGQELELMEDTVKLIQDEADERYINQLNEYHTDLMWQIVIQGLDMEFNDHKGNVLTEYEDKRAVLTLNGITIEQLTAIFNAIVKLGHHNAEELEEYIQRSVGLTSAIQRKIVARSKKQKGNKNKSLYNETIVMSEFNITPEEWERLHSIDKRVLNYSLLLKYHQEAENMEERERQQKLEQNKQKVMGKLPTFSGGGR